MPTLSSILSDVDIHDEETLLERLTNGIYENVKPVVFLLGSGLTAPPSVGQPGVPGAAGVIEIIKAEFNPQQNAVLSASLSASSNPYQDAFRFLLGRRGQQAANGIIKQSVAGARRPSTSGDPPIYMLDKRTTDDSCRAFDDDVSGWILNPGVRALGELAVGYPSRFGKTILTTNFDPLIGASVSAAGGTFFRTVLHTDGNLGQTEGHGCHIIHLHGYWYGADTLHTPRQLNQSRPQLKSSLTHLIRDRTVVVIGYGGWDDAFTASLMDVVLDNNAFPEVIWTFHDKAPNARKELISLLEPGIGRGRVSLYKGIDCNIFIPKLLSAWIELESPNPPPRPSYTGLALPLAAEMDEEIHAALPFDLDDDRPPVVDHFVGREKDVEILISSAFKVAFITGIGGLGKSAFAASYFLRDQTRQNFDHRVWKDCKEQSENFESHIVSIIKALSASQVTLPELSRQTPRSLAETLVSLTRRRRLLIVFDNVDHYVDLGTGQLIGSAGEFVDEILRSDSQTRIVFTCRPSIYDDRLGVLSRRLEGLDLQASIDLFRLRSAPASTDEVASAHSVTQGHALWLNLLAAHLAKNAPQVRLTDLLPSAVKPYTEIPDATLKSIWDGLRTRERVVLQALAETLRPTSIIQLEEYLSGQVRYNQISKAVRLLRNLNLLVIKAVENDDEGYELHPVIRAFIQKTSKIDERSGFINAILRAYAQFFGLHYPDLLKRFDVDTVRRWVEGAELSVTVEKYAEAVLRLYQVRLAFTQSAPPGDFVRVADLLMSRISINELMNVRHFDHVLHMYVDLLVNLGRWTEAAEVLESYEAALSGKDSRYINLCDMRTYLHWRKGEFADAIRWGSEGTNLKNNTGVDTDFSPEHNLALSWRDSGEIDMALNYFLKDGNLADVINPRKAVGNQTGDFYGNVGRCLQLMGQVEPAMVCYQKSARVLDASMGQVEVGNQGYIRWWLGELFVAQGDLTSALVFLSASKSKFLQVSPPLAERVQAKIESLPAQAHGELRLGPSSAEAYCQRWIRQAGPNMSSI